jgi:hypothetical protein
LLFFVDENSFVRLCFGFVGAGGRRFYLKPIIGDGTTCGVTKHGTKFEPQLGHFYLRGNDLTASCKHRFDEAIVPEEFRRNIWTTVKTVEEWKQLFMDYLHDATNQGGQGLGTTRFVFPDPEKFALKTPKKVPLFEGEFPAVTVPSELLDIKEQSRFLSENQYWWEEDDATSILPTPLFNFMKLLHSFLIKYDSWLVEPLDVLTLRADTIKGDLHKLKLNCDTLQLAIGRSLSLQGHDFPDIWSALEFVTTNSFGPNVDLEGIQQNISTLQASLSRLSCLPGTCDELLLKVESLEKLGAKHDSRFNTIHPILLAVKELTTNFHCLEWRVSSDHVIPPSPSQSFPQDPWSLHLTQAANGIPPGHPQGLIPGMQAVPVSPDAGLTQSKIDADARLRSIEHQLKSLEKRVVGDGIQIGRFLFQSHEDLRIWLATHVPTNRFGQFLDGVSIFDFLAQSHMDSQENMAHLYNSQKNGFDTIYKSKVISSMQNLFPNLFGKTSANGMDTSRTLPGLQTSDK